MIFEIIILTASLAGIVLGADWLVNGASSLARKMGISEFVIGLTIVGFGTSCPELVVSLNGAFLGNSDVSVGNVVGSNIFNTLMILGLTGIIAPISISSENKKRDIPLTIGVTLALILYGMRHTLFGIGSDGISRIGGFVFLAVFAAYIIFCFKTDSGASQECADKEYSVLISILFCLSGLAGLVIGGKFFVSSATDIAKQLGISDKFIAITILAGGTSLPELATCVVAAAKKKGQLALGNILGSNIFNILLILGCSAAVCPISLSGMNMVDMGLLLGSVLLVLLSCFIGKKNSLDRFDGALMLLFEAGYMAWLIYNM